MYKRQLLHEAGLDERPLTATAIGYTLAPRINASGRMGCASLAGELLLTDDPARGEELSRALCDLNRERQAIEAEIYTECQAMAEALPQPQRHALVLAGEQWHQGVVGIVASRLAEKYSCPAFMICLQDGKGKGSCRSFAGFNLFAALERCAPLLEGFGGHALAAGFTIREENIPAFAAAMNDYVCACTGGEEMVSALDIDGELDDVGLLTLEGVEGLELLEPYGAGNPKPVSYTHLDVYKRQEYRDDKDVVLAAGPLGHQGLAHRGGVPVKEGGHAGPVHRAVGVGVVVWSVRHPFLV